MRFRDISAIFLLSASFLLASPADSVSVWAEKEGMVLPPGLSDSRILDDPEAFLSSSSDGILGYRLPTSLDDDKLVPSVETVLLILSDLSIRPHNQVLIRGTGVGYMAGILAELFDTVYVQELSRELSNRLRVTAIQQGLTNLELIDTPYNGENEFNLIIDFSAGSSWDTRQAEFLAQNGVIYTALSYPRGLQGILKVTKRRNYWNCELIGNGLFSTDQ